MIKTAEENIFFKCVPTYKFRLNSKYYLYDDCTKELKLVRLLERIKIRHRVFFLFEALEDIDAWKHARFAQEDYKFNWFLREAM